MPCSVLYGAVHVVLVHMLAADVCVVELSVCSQAISHPSNDTDQDTAWHAVVPLVSHLKQFYQYSLALGQCVFTCSRSVSAHKL